MLLAFTYQERMRRGVCGSNPDEKQHGTVQFVLDILVGVGDDRIEVDLRLMTVLRYAVTDVLSGTCRRDTDVGEVLEDMFRLFHLLILTILA